MPLLRALVAASTSCWGVSSLTLAVSASMPVDRFLPTRCASCCIISFPATCSASMQEHHDMTSAQAVCLSVKAHRGDFGHHMCQLGDIFAAVSCNLSHQMHSVLQMDTSLV